MMFFHRVAFGEADDFTWAEQLYGREGSNCVRETDHDIVLPGENLFKILKDP